MVFRPIEAGRHAVPPVGCRWVEETVWFYQRTFRAPKLGRGERAWLVFDALDLSAVIFLNGVEFAWRVCLDLDGERPLADNFFDVYPGIPTALDWPRTFGVPKIIQIGNP